MKRTKWAAVLLAGVMLATVAGSAAAAPGTTVPGAIYEDGHAKGFNKPKAQVQQELQKAGVKDVDPDNFAAGSITVLLESGLMKPAADGQFKPEANVQGGEGVAVFAKVLGIASLTASDEEAMAAAQSAGLVDEGVTVDRDMTRLEVAKMLATALGVQATPWPSMMGFPFTDAFGLTPADRGVLKALFELGIFRGYPDGKFRPNGILTRAEIAILVDRILGAY